MNENVIRLAVAARESDLSLATHPIVRAAGDEGLLRERNIIHFDTLNLKLRRNEVLLTLNRQGTDWTQSIVRGATDTEALPWRTVSVKNGRLNIKKLKKQDDGQLLTGINIDKLKPLLVLHSRERCWRLTFPEKVELLLREERGHLRMGGVETPFHEVAVESPGGRNARLIETALSLAYHLEPASLLCAGPVERGFSRLNATLPPQPPSQVADLKPDMSLQRALVTLGEALLRLLQESRLIANHAGEEARWTGFRQLLWASDRLCTLIELHHADLPTEIRDEMVGEIRWLQQGLTRVRDWHHFFRDTLEPLVGQFPFQDGLDTLHERGEKRREAVFKEAAELLNGPRFTRLFLGLSQWLSAGDPSLLLDQPQRRRLSAAVIDKAREVLKQQVHSLGRRERDPVLLDADARGALRDEVDRLNHMVDLFIGLFPKKKLTPFREALTPLVENLDRLDESTIGRELFLQLLEPREEALGHLLQGWLGARNDRHMQDSEKAWRAFDACPPFWN